MGQVTAQTAISATVRARSSGAVSPQRRAMVLLGVVVLSAAILGTIVGHMLSASAPI